jgi:hypothetical protein
VQRYDAEIGNGVQAAGQYHVTSFPTLLVLSPTGDEIERVEEREPEGLAKVLSALSTAVMRDPLRLEDVAKERDPWVLLIHGRLAERRSPPDVRLARSSYRAAAARDPDNRAGVGAEATFAGLRIDAREQEALGHARALLGFLGRFPVSDLSLRALEGLVALDAGRRLDSNELRRATTAVVEEHRKARDGVGLRRAMVALAALGDDVERSDSHTLVLYVWLRDTAFSGAYSFEIRTSHEISRGVAGAASIDAVVSEARAPRLEERPLVTWTER